VFGLGRDRSKEPAVAAPAVEKPGGKGRPTPSRRQAEQRNRKPLVGAARSRASAPGATRAERKQARGAQRDVARAERMKARAAMLDGDERYLPARDRGPARRWVRDYVDARRNPGEYFLPVALIVVVLSLFRVGVVGLVAGLVLYAMMAGLIVDAVLLRRRIIRRVTEKFGEDAAAGTGGYGVMRALQLRRSRMPRPQVARGQYPH
jgi:hypothetical protein